MGLQVRIDSTVIFYHLSSWVEKNPVKNRGSVGGEVRVDSSCGSLHPVDRSCDMPYAIQTEACLFFVVEGASQDIGQSLHHAADNPKTTKQGPPEQVGDVHNNGVLR